jgi:hypothetical protein
VADEAVGSLGAGTPAGGWLAGRPGAAAADSGGGGDAVGVAAREASGVAAGAAVVPLGVSSSARASSTSAKSLDRKSAAAARSQSCLASCTACRQAVIVSMCHVLQPSAHCLALLRIKSDGILAERGLTWVRRRACSTLPCRSSICRLFGSVCRAAS